MRAVAATLPVATASLAGLVSPVGGLARLGFGGWLGSLGPAPAGAETEYRRGPDPTEASVTAPAGPFATASGTVPRTF